MSRPKLLAVLVAVLIVGSTAGCRTVPQSNPRPASGDASVAATESVDSAVSGEMHFLQMRPGGARFVVTAAGAAGDVPVGYDVAVRTDPSTSWIGDDGRRIQGDPFSAQAPPSYAQTPARMQADGPLLAKVEMTRSGLVARELSPLPPGVVGGLSLPSAEAWLVPIGDDRYEATGIMGIRQNPAQGEAPLWTITAMRQESGGIMYWPFVDFFGPSSVRLSGGGSDVPLDSVDAVVAAIGNRLVRVRLRWTGDSLLAESVELEDPIDPAKRPGRF